MTGPRPFCGEQTGQPAASPVNGILAVIGIISTVVGLIAAAKEAATGAAAFTLGGVGAIPLAGVAGALAVYGVTIYMYIDRCLPRDAPRRCWAGVVNGITESFDSGWDVVFPSGAMHPRVDVVVKNAYWPLVLQGAGLVACSQAPASSPMIQTFYKSAKVCAAGLGAMIGAGAAVVAAVAVAVAIGVIGCATIILCLFALLLAAIIGAVAAIAGAAIGGAIGRAIAGDDAPQAGGSSIAVGDLITVFGKLRTMEEFELANVGWWADSTSLHGEVAAPAPYTDLQADELVTDACPVREPVIK